MAVKDEPTRKRIESIKTDLQSIATCSYSTLASLQELLTQKDDVVVEKENVHRVQATARRKAATATTANVSKQACIALTPKERYLLATEVANTTLKTLADALKNPPPASSQPKSIVSDDTRDGARPPSSHPKTTSTAQKPLKERSASQAHNSPQKPSPRQASSVSSPTTSTVDAGLVATAECARTAFAFLGTSECFKVLGKDAQDLQYESGVLALIGKFVALGLDPLAVKELRILKKRLDRYIDQKKGKKEPESDRPGVQRTTTTTASKESLATLLDFGNVDLSSPALSLIASFQAYALRIIAKLKRPQVIESAWAFLKPSNPSSAANLAWHIANMKNGQVKGARQLETLAQALLSLCPSILSAKDDSQLQPRPDIVLCLQHLAFRIRKQWWTLVRHQGNEIQELMEPFSRCIIAFARRSQLAPKDKYKLAESLYMDLLEIPTESKKAASEDCNTSTAIAKALSSLAQAACLPKEALRWLEKSPSTTASSQSPAEKAAGLARIASFSIEAFLKKDSTPGLSKTLGSAANALSGSFSGTTSDLESLFLEANSLRRSATRLLLSCRSDSDNITDQASLVPQAITLIASGIHFSARFVGTQSEEDNTVKSQLRQEERAKLVCKSLKNIVDSTLVCCQQNFVSETQWKEVDAVLQDCSHILYRIEGEDQNKALLSPRDTELVQSSIARLSNAYWSIHLQLRKSPSNANHGIIAIQRSIDLVKSRSSIERDAANLSLRLEQLAEQLEILDRTKDCRKALAQCIQSYLNTPTLQQIGDLAAKHSLQGVFHGNETLQGLDRVLKSYHRSFVKSGSQATIEKAFFDDPELPTDIRATLLEWQLTLYQRTLSKNRHWDPNLKASIVELAKRLSDLYTPTQYPVRSLRFTVMLLHLSQSHPHILPDDLLEFAMNMETTSATKGTQDASLTMFGDHLKAMRLLKFSMRQSSPPISTIRESFSIWENLLDTITSYDALADHVDDIDEWLQDVESCVEFFNAKGEEYLALPILHLLVRVNELPGSPDPCSAVNSLCALGLQFLRLGYTGRAGLSFAKAEAFIKQSIISTEAELRWRIGYAEYLIAVGNIAKCTTVMADTRTTALADRQFMSLAKPSTALLGRMCFNRLLADASYVYSLLETATGSYKEATKHVKHCVSLNRRIWAAFESRANARKMETADEMESEIDVSNKQPFDPLSSMRNDRGIPLVMSVTHDALDGAEFWFLVPALYRGLMQHSQILAHQGILHEAIYVAEQAEKVASATKSPTLITDNASWRADCWAQSGRTDKAEHILKSLKSSSSRKCLSTAGYHSAVARMHHWNEQYEAEIVCYDSAEQLLSELSSPAYMQTLERYSPSVSSITKQIESMMIEEPQVPQKKAVTRGRKPAVKAAPTRVSKPATKTRARAPAPSEKTIAKTKRAVTNPETPAASSVADQCSVLRILHASLMDRRALTFLLQDDLTQSIAVLEQVDNLQGLSTEVSHIWASYKAIFAQSVKQISEDFAVNTLPESTIAFPAIGLKERRASEAAPVKRAIVGSATAAKGGRAKKKLEEDFMATLYDARERLVEAHRLSATCGSNHLFQQISLALGHITVLLSAVSGAELCGSLHPLYAAYMSEIPKSNALRLTQESIEAENHQILREESLQWPELTTTNIALLPVSEFQRELVDIIPETWTAISLALNESRDELYITRYESGHSPFVLRLPLARHASRDMDEEEFSFEDGKKDLEEIIELSDFSTKTAKDMTSKEDRRQWWAERQALDTRLHELLINIENIWLGGFKGVFSQHPKQPSLVARFRKSLENILDQHLPSRRKKSKQKPPTLDTRVLDLFIGLGDANNEELDLDEALMDLIYFVVDILQFNGECNAYDEIDFDAMVVETHEALRAYHMASQKSHVEAQHTILVLDKNLHGFPWESLPCLQQTSISRLPSLAALRERLLSARASKFKGHTPAGHYVCTDRGGTSILNPSGDLSHTVKTLKPVLNKLKGPWNHITNRPPSEKEFEDSLREKDLVLYFGHGSGSQYIKLKSVRRLYDAQETQKKSQPSCATTLLFGCSSVHLTENGIYEPSGMLASYLAAGAPAVVGMLWDVTDKDCDRLAVKAGELWGLWPTAEEEGAPSDVKVPTKTPAKKTKGKGRVAQFVEDVENVRGAATGKKEKVDKEINAEGVSSDGPRRRGVGLDEAVREARTACVLRYLNGAAAVVYGIPVYLD